MTGGAKITTWPYAVCEDPKDSRLWNVSGLDLAVIFAPGVPLWAAKQTHVALCQAFYWAKGFGGVPDGLQGQEKTAATTLSEPQTTPEQKESR